MKQHLAFALTLIASQSAAQTDRLVPDRVGILGFSHHTGASGFFDEEDDFHEWNEFHPGIVISYDLSDWQSADFALFENSFETLGATATINQHWLAGEAWSIGTFYGLAHYQDFGRFQPTSLDVLDPALRDVFAVAGLQARYGNLFAIYSGSPKADDQDKATSVTAVGLTWEFGQ